MNNRIINSYVENFCGQNDFDSNKFLLFSTYQICKKHNLDDNIYHIEIDNNSDGKNIIEIHLKNIYSLEHKLGEKNV